MGHEICEAFGSSVVSITRFFVEIEAMFVRPDGCVGSSPGRGVPAWDGSFEIQVWNIIASPFLAGFALSLQRHRQVDCRIGSFGARSGIRKRMPNGVG